MRIGVRMRIGVVVVARVLMLTPTLVHHQVDHKRIMIHCFRHKLRRRRRHTRSMRLLRHFILRGF